jgi:hypothetical protein
LHDRARLRRLDDAGPGKAGRQASAGQSHGREAAKPAANASDKTKSAKPKAAATKTGKNSVAVKPAASVPLPRARPVMTLASATSAPTKASLAPTPILPNVSFSLVTPAAAAPSAAPPEATSPIVRARAVPSAALAVAESASTSAADVALTKQAIDLVRRGKIGDAGAVQKTIGDPLAQKLIEWASLRSEESSAGFDRLSTFVSANPSWPGIVTLRRRTESAVVGRTPRSCERARLLQGFQADYRQGTLRARPRAARRRRQRDRCAARAPGVA